MNPQQPVPQPQQTQPQKQPFSLVANKPTPLFDGAMSINLDQNFLDVSELTQVPDNQTVFGHKFTDQSIIIEILQHEESVDDISAGTYFFTDLAHANECAPGEFEILEEKPAYQLNKSNPFPDCYQTIIFGKQKVPHAREKVKNTVFVGIYVLRLKKYNAEIMITFNDPIELVGRAALNAIIVHDLPKSKAFFEQLAASFKIHDYSIFG